jgi:hypothetical protein
LVLPHTVGASARLGHVLLVLPPLAAAAGAVVLHRAPAAPHEGKIGKGEAEPDRATAPPHPNSSSHRVFWVLKPELVVLYPFSKASCGASFGASFDKGTVCDRRMF